MNNGLPCSSGLFGPSSSRDSLSALITPAPLSPAISVGRGRPSLHDLSSYLPDFSSVIDAMSSSVRLFGFSLRAFINFLPDFLFTGSFNPETLLVAMQNRLASGSTYLELCSTFLNSTNHIEAFSNFLLYLSLSSSFVSVPITFDDLLIDSHALSLSLTSVSDILRILLCTQFYWTFDEWEALVHHVSQRSTLRFYNELVPTDVLLNLLTSNHIIVVDSVTKHYYISLDVLRDLHALAKNTPTLSPWDPTSVRDPEQLVLMLKEVLNYLNKLPPLP